MVRRVDIKCKNKFRHKGCFIACFNSYNANCIDIEMNFNTKLVFQLEIQITIPTV